MASIDSVSNRTNGHDPHRKVGVGEARCPTCGQPISASVANALKDRLAAEKAKVAGEAKLALEKAKKEAAKDAEMKVKLVLANQDAVIAGRLETQRIRLESKTTEAVNVERSKMFAEKLRLEEQLADMQRRLQARTAHQIGEPAEVDLFDALVAAFPDDRISRVVKGQKGPDVIVQIVHGGQVVGSVVLDSKAHARWSNRFTAKLRLDQLAESAEWAVLSTTVFPKEARTTRLHLQDGVIVADPACVVILVHLLRRQIVENHRLKLTTAARDEKAEKLLAYIVSPGCSDLLDQIAKLTADMASLDATETAAHQKTWTKRAEMIRGVQAVHDEFSSAITRIIGGAL